MLAANSGITRRKETNCRIYAAFVSAGTTFADDMDSLKYSSIVRDHESGLANIYLRAIRQHKQLTLLAFRSTGKNTQLATLRLIFVLNHLIVAVEYCK